MKGTQLGEFEELVLLVVGVLYPDAYGYGIRQEIMKESRRNVTIGAVHSALSRLQDKGFVKSEFAEATHERGGRRKRLFQITASGKRALETNHQLRNSLFDRISDLALKGLNFEGSF